MIRSKALRASARQQPCTLNIAGICNYDPATTVLAHLPDESHGMGQKADDIAAVFACAACHDCLDGRHSETLSREDKEFYMRRGLVRTWRIWIEHGLITVKGAA